MTEFPTPPHPVTLTSRQDPRDTITTEIFSSALQTCILRRPAFFFVSLLAIHQCSLYVFLRASASNCHLLVVLLLRTSPALAATSPIVGSAKHKIDAESGLWHGLSPSLICDYLIHPTASKVFPPPHRAACPCSGMCRVPKLRCHVSPLWPIADHTSRGARGAFLLRQFLFLQR